MISVRNPVAGLRPVVAAAWACRKVALPRVASRQLLHPTVVSLVVALLVVGGGELARAVPGAQAAAALASAESAQRLSPEGEAAFRALVEAGQLSDLRWPDFSDYRVHVKNFYEPAGYSLAWVRDGQATPQALTVIGLLQDADSKGLQAEDYDGPRWAARLARLKQTKPPPSEEDLARFDLELTVSLMRYISDLHIGRVNPRHFKFGLDIEHKKYNLPDLLRQQIVDGEDVAEVLAEAEPQFEGYRRTLKALQSYLVLAREGDGEPLPLPAKTVKPGDPYSAAGQLAGRLEVLGDLPPDRAAALEQSDATSYTGALVSAVKHFQHRHGLDEDGRLGPKTVEEINTPLGQRVLQLQLALERWRWVPPGFARPPIVVNIPEFRLRAFNEHQQVVLSMKVVVGKAYRHQTPVFANEMKYVIFRPYWNVPLSIQLAELVPKLRKDRAYLAKHGFEVVNNREQVVGRGVVSDSLLEQLRSGKLGIRQTPGGENALGLVKFLFPNEYNVYLHGTPAPELFAKARRDFSHGCIRVEDPLALAEWVLRDKPEWTADRIKAVMNGTETVQVNLDKPIPVLIFYTTAVVLASGEVEFFDDIYGHDRELEQVLAKGYPYPG
jgi:L,D-transpeptidase YcbB